MASLVSTVSWVNRGVAKPVPEKLKLEANELEGIINDLKGAGERSDDETLGEDLPRKPAKKASVHKDGEEESSAVTCEEGEADDDDDDTEDEEDDGSEIEDDTQTDDDDPYNLADYDNEDLDDEVALERTIAGMTVYADNKDDPYITLPDEDDEEEDRADFEIKPTDNLIIAGRAAPECSLLEVYVYNEKSNELYCHHDIILPAFPLSTAWINYDIETKSPGNLVAVGSMEPVISIWELDVVEVIEPIATLGSKQTQTPNKKKKKEADSGSGLEGHTDAVLDLSWHSLAPTALASASADHTAAIWDLSEGKQLLSLKHSEKVQTLNWHPKESSVLLTGAFDCVVRLFDCRQQGQPCLKWKIKGEVERVLWDSFSPFNFFASDDSGHIYYMDSRKEKTPVYTLGAHKSAVTGITQCQNYKGCLVTTAMDSLLKVWDTTNNKPNCVYEKKFKDQGGLTCVASCPESNSVVVIGSEKCLTVYDISNSSQVSKHFDGASQAEVTNRSSTNTIDEAMDNLTLTTGTNSDDEMTEYLENIADPKRGGARQKSKQSQQQTRKKKTAKRKGKK